MTATDRAPAGTCKGTAGALTLGSMCTGYAGLEQAVAAVLDVEPVWVADKDPGAAAILAHRMPGVPNLGDLTRVDWDSVEPVDIVAAGFPCTDLSFAGLGAGIRKGTRSGLWFTIADAIDVLRPRLVVLENVRAIVSRRPGLDVVLGDLARLGFDAEWTCNRASDIGAAHQRERWFLLAWPADAPRPRLEGARLRGRPPGHGGVAADTDDERGHGPSAEHRAGGREVATGDAAADPAGIGEREPADAPLAVAGGGHTRPEPRRRGVQPAAYPARDGRHEGRPEPTRLVRGPDAALGGSANVDWGGYGPAIDRWARVLGRPAPAPRVPTGRDGADQLNPAFVEWLMGLDEGHVTAVPGLARNQQLTALGNGVVPAQGAAAIAHLLDRMGALFDLETT